MRADSQTDGPQPRNRFPKDGAVDATIDFFFEGHRFIGNRCDRLGSAGFETRLFGRPVVCIRGAEAARAFYGSGHVAHEAAVPDEIARWLENSDASLHHGEAHRRQRDLLARLSHPEETKALSARVAQRWYEASQRWASARPDHDFVLHDEARELLCRAACEWAGVPLREGEVQKRTHDLGSFIDASGRPGWGLVRGVYSRHRARRWARRIIDQTRKRHAGTARTHVETIARHEDAAGARLGRDVAADDLLELLRAVVSQGRFVVFAALALYHFPETRTALVGANDSEHEAFVREVRRFYPFFPTVAGRCTRALDIDGCHIERGTRLLFDLYGTQHDATIWNDPERFRPRRFEERALNGFSLLPNEGSEALADGRRPGSSIEIELGKIVTRLLVSTEYRVPKQDLSLGPRHVPALPASGFLFRTVSGRAVVRSS